MFAAFYSLGVVSMFSYPLGVAFVLSVSISTTAFGMTKKAPAAAPAPSARIAPSYDLEAGGGESAFATPQFQPRSCKVANGYGTQTWKPGPFWGGTWSACNIGGCNSGYKLTNGVCTVVVAPKPVVTALAAPPAPAPTPASAPASVYTGPVYTGPVAWNFVTQTYDGMYNNYTPFFVDGSKLTFYTGGPGMSSGNGLVRIEGDMNEVLYSRTIVHTGPDAYNLNYFRGVSSSRAKIPNSRDYEHWLIAEVSRCYSSAQCNKAGSIIRMAVYRSTDSGTNWTYQGLMTLNGQPYYQWEANDALVFDPTKPAVVDTVNPTNNRFIMFGSMNTILISADGVNYRSVLTQWPSSIASDSAVFVSMEKTPYGFHMMAGANWDEQRGTTIVRHLFSRDLKTWKVLETKSVMKNPRFYKGVHLRYDPSTNRLWAFSGCEASSCGYLAWMTPEPF
jgi:hypothetical protein